MTAGRPANIVRPVKLTTNVPEDVKAQLDLHLFSHIEGRVPYGAYSKFLAERVREFFDPQSSAMKLAVLKRRIIEAETLGWSDEQKLAIETFRDHILGLFPS